jgi:hypothetical protein
LSFRVESEAVPEPLPKVPGFVPGDRSRCRILASSRPPSFLTEYVRTYWGSSPFKPPIQLSKVPAFNWPWVLRDFSHLDGRRSWGHTPYSAPPPPTDSTPPVKESSAIPTAPSYCLRLALSLPNPTIHRHPPRALLQSVQRETKLMRRRRLRTLTTILGRYLKTKTPRLGMLSQPVWMPRGNHWRQPIGLLLPIPSKIMFYPLGRGKSQTTSQSSSRSSLWHQDRWLMTSGRKRRTHI